MAIPIYRGHQGTEGVPQARAQPPARATFCFGLKLLQMSTRFRPSSLVPPAFSSTLYSTSVLFLGNMYLRPPPMITYGGQEPSACQGSKMSRSPEALDSWTPGLPGEVWRLSQVPESRVQPSRSLCVFSLGNDRESTGTLLWGFRVGLALPMTSS